MSAGEIDRSWGTLDLAKAIGDNPAAYTITQLQGALLRLFEAKKHGRHSARAQEKTHRRVQAIQREIGNRLDPTYGMLSPRMARDNGGL